MLYSLPNGKVINISYEQWESLTDEDIQDLVANDIGCHINNPFSKNVLNSGKQLKNLKEDDSDNSSSIPSNDGNPLDDIL